MRFGKHDAYELLNKGCSDYMSYKMVVMDMDGTLLTNDKKISDRNREALKRASQMGVKIVVSTGRIFASALAYGEMLGVDTPIIASNGAYIREKDMDEVAYAKGLGESNIREIISLSHNHGLVCQFYTWNTIFTEKISYSSLNYERWNKSLPEGKKVRIEVIDKSDWDIVIKNYGNSILKCVISDDDFEKLSNLRDDISKLDVEIASSYPNNFEVMSKGVSKGKAVEVLAGIYNLSRDEVICMGDSENDLSMIQYAGMGIAMGNACEMIKNAARFVTLSNEEDGVAFAVEKFILSCK